MAETTELQLEKGKLGELHFRKGKAGGHDLISWDGVHPCRGEVCPIHRRCYCLGKNNPGVAKCAVQRDYIENLLTSLYAKHPILDSVQAHRVGMHLIPLYSQLIRLKVVEMGVEDMVVETAKGGLSVHPVFKEIRDVMKAISATWKDMELEAPTVKEPKIPPKENDVETAPVKTGDSLEGDRSHAERIANRTTDRKGVIR